MNIPSPQNILLLHTKTFVANKIGTLAKHNLFQ